MTCVGSCSANGLQSPIPSERIKEALLSQKTLIELSAIPIVSKFPVSLIATQFTCLHELSKFIEPIDGSYFSVKRTWLRISL